jgi:hypothetical protein
MDVVKRPHVPEVPSMFLMMSIAMLITAATLVPLIWAAVLDGRYEAAHHLK